MASAKGILIDTLARWATRAARIASVHDLGGELRTIVLAGADLNDVTWTPGDKIQLLLPTRDVRTYTPSRWAGGELELIAFAHGDAPGATWSRCAKAGDQLRFVGPQKSLRRSSRPTVLFGDETSFGLAVAFRGGPLHAVFEVSDVAHTAIVEKLGITATCIERAAGDAHIDRIADAIAAKLREQPRSELVMSGRAQSIQLVRERLRARGVTDRPANKAYWSVGKVGLD